MNIQRFQAPTAREALALARKAFGDGTLILSNRSTPLGVEVVATGEDALQALTPPADMEPTPVAADTSPVSKKAKREQDKNALAESRKQVEADADRLNMSTLSFQDYVRERMLRRRHEALQVIPKDKAPSSDKFQKTLQQLARNMGPDGAHEEVLKSTLHTTPQTATRSGVAKGQPAASTVTAPAIAPQGLMDELHAMKSMIEDRFNTLAWLGQARQSPIQSGLMMKMIRAGFSPALARTLLEKLPASEDSATSTRWVMDMMERNLHTDAGSPSLHEEGGIHALVGATGVGKTTTTAKLAGLCAEQYGAASVGLISLDTYRVGAHEQLRAYGRMMGVVAHQAHDQEALKDLLGLLSNKKLVLIDTTGVAPRDPRKRDMLNMLDLPDVKRLLVLNAGGQGDTLDDVISAFKLGSGQSAILSKLDEAVKLAPALDAALRHQLVLRGVTTGQRVPEDWERADAAHLVRMAFRTPVKSAFDPNTEDLNFIFGGRDADIPARPGQLHA